MTSMSGASTEEDKEDSDEEDLSRVDADLNDLVSKQEHENNGGQSDESAMGIVENGVLRQVMHEEEERHDNAKREAQEQYDQKQKVKQVRVSATGRNPYLLAFRA